MQITKKKIELPTREKQKSFDNKVKNLFQKKEPLKPVESENKPEKLNEKEIKYINIFVNCFIAFVVLLMFISSDFLGGFVMLAFMLFARKKWVEEMIAGFEKHKGS